MYQSTRRSPVPAIELPDVVPMPNRSGMLSLEAVRREVREIGDENADAVLHLITECALSLTGASGAALALLTDDKMICRARAGEPAPPLGAAVDVKQGLSGECVRSGLLVSCEDTENDPRIDLEVSRTLGIGSLMAAPIMSNVRVVGLLEIFSLHPRGFTNDHETVLERLVEMIPKSLWEKAQPENTQPEKIRPEAPVTPEAVQPPGLESGSIESGASELISIPATREELGEQKPEVADEASQQVPSENASDQVLDQPPEPALAAPSGLLHWVLLNWALLAPVVAGLSMALGYLVGSVIEKR
jgi:putative methionine-R-sulfoxide reductase with GAF domain